MSLTAAANLSGADRFARAWRAGAWAGFPGGRLPRGGLVRRVASRTVPVTLLDVSASLTPFEAEEPYELFVTFDSSAPELVPERGFRILVPTG